MSRSPESFGSGLPRVAELKSATPEHAPKTPELRKQTAEEIALVKKR